MKSLFLIKAMDHINPQQDHRWVPDGENMWFLPCIIDLKNKTHSGYWYGTHKFLETSHYHTGVAHGTVLRGKILLSCNEEIITINENESFLLPPNLTHSAELIPGENGFLFFATAVAKAIYRNSEEVLDADNYYASIIKYYTEHKINLDHCHFEN